MENTKRIIWKSIIGAKTHCGTMDILLLPSETLVKKPQNIIYGIRVEVDAYIP
ncbi:conserved hypothetical protein [Methanosarcina acetivorans C2A]|uniref:Uncharacterized protein n=1 Tax=Methanosarcina acetivorans (strain ATCC 35395 / DSM 2834 / JCM 12185 / C2A) TaxID=188937 RepID=Q8TKN8_METAC|nr:conserved hypothetical protein [Methanosarcina acetivorans C2A]